MVIAGLTLALDASASVGTLAVLREGEVVVDRTVEMRGDGEEEYFPAILGALGDAGAGRGDLDRIVCGAGPGSFTALRVVGAIAKGLALGLDRPLLGVPSLALIVGASEETRAADTRWVATLDAMRGDRYAALVTVGAGGEVRSVESLGLFPAPELAARARALEARLVGPDEAVRAEPHARGLARCLPLLAGATPADLASWEPLYGRLAEAQVKWEAAHGRPLDARRSPA
ncbi:MAG: tRNA (adenosine(37)-N6)-threonylcarbamoyltransferase complex dimerization subunit type 1 TsaB [Gemmatimonadetes bacterium]|nr:tRNA (adenosine(37)-N6)-threonylcarbamoyltransferase complex dimerization subunit type 1 TsaB [Gemmatimonadota bacterium]